MTSENRQKIEQKSQWNKVFIEEMAFFGQGPSEFAKKSLELFRREAVRSLLELGCGQGRDTIFLARNDLHVTALDYSDAAVATTLEKAATAGVSSMVVSRVHDVRQVLPFPDASFDACYSHMLLCMELSTAEIDFILGEILRVLRPGGLVVYSVRSDRDKHYRFGTHLGEDIYQIGDFVVHFFTTEKIRSLAKGYTTLGVERLTEGSLPRDLYCVTMKKEPTAGTSPNNLCEERDMADPLDKFQEFMDAALAPGVLNHKTKQLVALGAALAAGCDP
ncbi:SAM-dependent methyltransferase [Desulfuromonas sp. AOP6]|nr:methyltransferase domain-containing selenoprotein MduS [Desulfuromonas sp. AOP6]BCA79054.1 SAM-dependent methyltransferase [Desulfuromonas sp. AOP6]